MPTTLQERKAEPRPRVGRAELRHRRRSRVRRRRASVIVLLLSLSGLAFSSLDVFQGGRLPLPAEDAVTRAAGSGGGSGGGSGPVGLGGAGSAPALRSQTRDDRQSTAIGTPVSPRARRPLFAVSAGQAFARVRTLTLYVPGREVVAIGYHQAKSSLSLPFRPLGAVAVNDNANFKAPRPTAGPEYVVLETRRRGTHPASAVDIAMGRRDRVLAPISGVVTEVREYRLYGAWPDLRVEIDPRDGSNLLVVMIHLIDVRVRIGQRVVAGITPIGLARVLPERSYINDYVGEGVPHVHIEVKERGSSGQ